MIWFNEAAIYTSEKKIVRTKIIRTIKFYFTVFSFQILELIVL